MAEFDIHKRFYALSANMELEPSGMVDGWGVYSGCEGDDPSFVGFFVREDTARAVLQAKDADGDDLVFDGQAMPAVLTERGVVTSNSYEINSHEKLRAKLAESWWDDDRLVSGCIGADLRCGCHKCNKGRS